VKTLNTMALVRKSKRRSMKPANMHPDAQLRILEGGIERIGQSEATLQVEGVSQAYHFSQLGTAPDHTVAVGALMDGRHSAIEKKHDHETKKSA